MRIRRADAYRAAVQLIEALGPAAAQAAQDRTTEMLLVGDAGRFRVWAMIRDAVDDILDQTPYRRNRRH